MKLGENILKLRKKMGLSQEQLGEKVDVTRQTISNWELGETSPNPEQLISLSRALNVSIDELLDNEIREELIKKVSNTEKLAGISIKILKVIGICFLIYIIFMILAIVGLGIYSHFNKDNPNKESSATTICTINKINYQITFGPDNYYKCDACSSKMNESLKELTDFSNINESFKNIEEYFNEHHGYCQ